MSAIGYTTDKTRLSAAIASISRRGARLDNDIWSAAVGSLAHAQEHGDFSLFSALLSAMPKGSRVGLLVQWAQDQVPVACAYDTKKKTWKVKIDQKSDLYTAGDRSTWGIDILAESPWFEFKKTNTEKVFDLTDLIAIVEKIAEGKKQGATDWAMDGATAAYNVLSAMLAEKTRAALESAETA
jgi:hypothetical protein